MEKEWQNIPDATANYYTTPPVKVGQMGFVVVACSFSGNFTGMPGTISSADVGDAFHASARSRRNDFATSGHSQYLNSYIQ